MSKRFDINLFRAAAERLEEGLPLTADMKDVLAFGLEREAEIDSGRLIHTERRQAEARWLVDYQQRLVAEKLFLKKLELTPELIANWLLEDEQQLPSP